MLLVTHALLFIHRPTFFCKNYTFGALDPTIYYNLCWILKITIRAEYIRMFPLEFSHQWLPFLINMISFYRGNLAIVDKMAILILWLTAFLHSYDKWNTYTIQCLWDLLYIEKQKVACLNSTVGSMFQVKNMMRW